MVNLVDTAVGGVNNYGTSVIVSDRTAVEIVDDRISMRQ